MAAAAALGDWGENLKEQESHLPVPRRERLSVVEKAEPPRLGVLVLWTPPPALRQFGKCRLRTLHSVIPLPSQGPAWQR